jgi:subtilisin family serine protease
VTNGPWWEHAASGVKRLLSLELAPVDVAVVDSGLDAAHPELAERVDSARRVLSLWGEWFVLIPPNTNQDERNHGTPVAGLVARAAPNARLHDLRIFDSAGRASGDTVVAGLREALRLNCPVILVTAVCEEVEAPRLRVLCEEAHRRGLTVVAARRNVPRPDLGFPAEFSSCVSVCSGEYDSLYEYCYTGRSPIEFRAWGEGVEAPLAGGGAAPVEGASFAAGVMAGICALLLGAFPGLPPFEVKTALKAFAQHPTSAQRG